MEVKSEKLKTENHNSKFKTKTVLSFTLSFYALRFTLLAKVVACLLIFTFTINNVTYGYEKITTLRGIRAGECGLNNKIAASIKPRFFEKIMQLHSRIKRKITEGAEEEDITATVYDIPIGREKQPFDPGDYVYDHPYKWFLIHTAGTLCNLITFLLLLEYSGSCIIASIAILNFYAFTRFFVPKKFPSNRYRNNYKLSSFNHADNANLVYILNLLFMLPYSIPHELGHYFTAKFFGLKARLGPTWTAIGIRKKFTGNDFVNTAYAINVLKERGLFPFRKRKNNNDKKQSTAGKTSNRPMGGGMRNGDLRKYAQSATAEELIEYIIKSDIVKQIKVIRDALKKDGEKLAEFDNLLAESGLRERYDRLIMSFFMNFSIESVRNDKLKIKEGAKVNIEDRDVIFTVNSRPVDSSSSNIYVTVGCSSCAPIICQASSSKGMTNHLLHFLTLDRDGGPATERIYKPFKYVGNMQSIFVIAIDRKFEALFKELSQRLLAEYKNAKVLLIPVEKLEVKSAIFMQEGIAINAGKRDLYRIALPKKGTLKTVALRWDDVYKIHSKFQKNRVATVKFENLPKILKEITESPSPQDAAAEETISNIVPPIIKEGPDENLDCTAEAALRGAA